METALIVSNLLLWIAVIVLAALVLALLRQIGVLHERVSPAGALVTGDGPRIGDPAPVVEVEDWSGQRRRVGEAGMATLLLFVSPTCPLCKTMLAIVESIIKREGGWLRLLLASDGARAEHEAFVRDQRLLRQHPYILSTELGLAYRVGKLPYAVLIDAQGVVRGRGLVNTREHVESLFEAMEKGVGTLQEYLGRNVA